MRSPRHKLYAKALRGVVRDMKTVGMNSSGWWSVRELMFYAHTTDLAYIKHQGMEEERNWWILIVDNFKGWVVMWDGNAVKKVMRWRK
jgi:hypothetical protein